MDIHKTCAFFGHSEIIITEELKQKVKKHIEELIVYQGYNIFMFGGFGMFDNLCWQIVTELKQKYTSIKRVYCLSEEKHLKVNKRPFYLKNEDYEEFTYFSLEFDWWYTKIYYRNRAIINNSDFIIFYVKNQNYSGAYKAMKYAIKIKKSFINLA